MQCLKMILLVVAVLTPIFVLANELDGDEFIKAGGGIACGAVAMGAWKLLEKSLGSKS